MLTPASYTMCISKEDLLEAIVDWLAPADKGVEHEPTWNLVSSAKPTITQFEFNRDNGRVTITFALGFQSPEVAEQMMDRVR